jgi:cytochrome c-type biogenesis protein CcsB
MIQEALCTNLVFSLLFFSMILHARFDLGSGNGVTKMVSASVLESNNPELTQELTPLGTARTNFPLVTVLLSISVLTFFLSFRWFQSGHPPLSNLYESLLFLTWALLAFYLILFFTETRELNKKSNLVSQLINFLLVSTSLFVFTFAQWRLPAEMQQISSLVPALQSNWLLMHVSIMILSYSALLGGSLFSIAYLSIEWIGLSYKPVSKQNEYRDQVVQENIQTILTKLDQLSSQTLSFAFPLLTLGILSGAVWANEAWGSYWSWDPKETWALITWFVFSIYLHGRLNKGWTGNKAAWVGTIGFFVIWVCYLGVNLLGKGLHSYGWWAN